MSAPAKRQRQALPLEQQVLSLEQFEGANTQMIDQKLRLIFSQNITKDQLLPEHASAAATNQFYKKLLENPVEELENFMNNSLSGIMDPSASSFMQTFLVDFLSRQQFLLQNQNLDTLKITLRGLLLEQKDLFKEVLKKMMTLISSNNGPIPAAAGPANPVTVSSVVADETTEEDTIMKD